MKVVFDMDGTLADNSAREHLARKAAGNFGSSTEKTAAWEEFHAGIPNDLPIWPVFNVLAALWDCGHRIEIWTARPERYRAVTEEWCAKFHVLHHKLRMRPDGDWRPSYVLKCDWFQRDPHVQIVFEDHPETTKRLRALGVIVAQVGEQTGVTK